MNIHIYCFRYHAILFSSVLSPVYSYVCKEVYMYIHMYVENSTVSEEVYMYIHMYVYTLLLLPYYSPLFCTFFFMSVHAFSLPTPYYEFSSDTLFCTHHQSTTTRILSSISERLLLPPFPFFFFLLGLLPFAPSVQAPTIRESGVSA